MGVKVTLAILFCSATALIPDFNKTPSGVPGKLCYNGKRDSRGNCVCEIDYAGKLCERQKHCESFERHANYSCITCQEGWMGTECDFIDCQNGIAKSPVECICDEPYSGKFCDELQTTDVYLYYNTAIYSMGPLGVITIIPLILILVGCNKLTKLQNIRRAEKAVEEQFQRDVSTNMVEVLLKK
jgi:hypothetical protein